MVNIFDSYIKFIKDKNKEKLSSSKSFYILINSKKTPEISEEKIILNLKEKYFKIKNSLLRCGNNIIEIKNKNETENIINSFFINKGENFERKNKKNNK